MRRRHRFKIDVVTPVHCVAPGGVVRRPGPGAERVHPDDGLLAELPARGRAAAGRAHAPPGALLQVLPGQALRPQAAVAGHARTLRAQGALHTGHH